MTDERDICNAVRRPGSGGGWTLRLHLIGVAFESTTNALWRVAFRLADSAAISDIKCNCREADGTGLPPPESHDRYYDTTSAEPDIRHVIAEALDYLTLRGRLDRHPEKRHLVRFRSTPSPEGGHRG